MVVAVIKPDTVGGREPADGTPGPPKHPKGKGRLAAALLLLGDYCDLFGVTRVLFGAASV